MLEQWQRRFTGGPQMRGMLGQTLAQLAPEGGALLLGLFLRQADQLAENRHHSSHRPSGAAYLAGKQFETF